MTSDDFNDPFGGAAAQYAAQMAADDAAKKQPDPAPQPAAKPETLPQTAPVKAAVQGVGDDELSRAIRDAARPKIADIPEQPKHVPKYALAYSLHGVPIVETHATIPHALARIRALRSLGIVPATKTLAA